MTSSAKWQAEKRPGTISRSSGRSVRHTSCAIRQRGLKAQPGGIRIRLGGRPPMAARVCPFWSSRGIDSSSPRVYGWAGEP